MSRAKKNIMRGGEKAQGAIRNSDAAHHGSQKKPAKKDMGHRGHK